MAKKITLTQINSVLKNIEHKSTEVEWNGLTLEIKNKLNLEEVMRAVTNIVDSCFVGDDNEYSPELLEFVKRGIIIENYTNVTLPRNNMQKLFDLVFNTNLFEVVLSNIDLEQFALITDAVDEKIIVKNESNISQIRDEISEMYKGLEDISNMFAEAFGDVDPEDFIKAGEALANGSLLDEEKAMKAWIAEHKNDKKPDIMPKK